MLLFSVSYIYLALKVLICIFASQRKLDECSVAKSVQGVSGVKASTLIDHFTGVAKLQAERIRQLGESLTGGGGFGNKNNTNSKLFGKDVGMWGTHWLQLEAHLLNKQNSELKNELEKLSSKHESQVNESTKEIETLKEELIKVRKETNLTISVLSQRSELAESRSASVASHLKKETERSSLFEQNLHALKDELDKTKQEASLKISSLLSPYTTASCTVDMTGIQRGGLASTSTKLASDDNMSRRILELESLLKERSSQVGVLMETVEALQVTTAASASTRHRGQGQDRGQDRGGTDDNDDPLTPIWALTSMKKQVAKLSVEYSAALASAGMQERRSAHLARLTEDTQNESKFICFLKTSSC